MSVPSTLWISVPKKSFSGALRSLTDGRRVARSGWNGRGMWIFLVQPTHPGHLPYLAMSTATGDIVPWLASQTDLLAQDWEILI